MFEEIIIQFMQDNPRTFMFIYGLIDILAGIFMGMLIMYIIRSFRKGKEKKDVNRKMVDKKDVSQEQLSELMRTIKVGDDIVFDNEFGAFKIIKLEGRKEIRRKTFTKRIRR